MNYYQPKNDKETEIFKKFKSQVLKLYMPRHRGFNNYFVRRNFLYLGYVALALFVVNIAIFLYALTKYDYDFIPRGLIIVSSAIFSVYSLFLFVLTFFARKWRTFALRIIENVYYYMIIFMSTLLILIENSYLDKIGAPIMVETLSVATFYLAIFIFLPLSHIGDMIALHTTIIVTGVIPYFLVGGDTYSISLNIFIRLLICCAYFAIFFVQKNLYKKSEDLNKLNDNLIITAHKDPLTFSMNRLALDTYWKYLLENEKVNNVGVIMFDIDNFKSYNDTYSHIMGDNILTTICKVVTDVLIEKELYFFRYGGEEFMIILENPTEQDIINLAIDIKNAVYDANLERTDIKTYDRVTITVGCSNLKRIEMIHGDFVSKADKALYTGKNSTKNCVVFKNQIY